MPDLSATAFNTTGTATGVGTAFVDFTIPIDTAALHVRLHDAGATPLDGEYAKGGTDGVTLDNNTWTEVYRRNPSVAVTVAPVVKIKAGTAGSTVDWDLR